MLKLVFRSNFFVFLLTFLKFYLVMWLGQTVVLADIKPDSSLLSESSSVRQGVNVGGKIGERIDGGAVRGANLFHSFTEFNINNGQQVYFSNPAGVENILTRVTGSNRSDILGTLGVLGNANLFLINPNGIIFGANARLDIAGSFVASTADSLVFNNGFAFSAINPQTPPLLTVNVPLGLQFGLNAKPIQVQASLPGFFVPTGKTLALLGGDIFIEGATLQATAGRVELGSIRENEIGINLENNRLKFSFPETVTRGDIFLSQAALINTSGEGAGDIHLFGRRVSLTAGSRLVTNTLGANPGGSLLIDASESVDLAGIRASGNPGGLFARTLGTGAAANVIINTGRLTVQEGARISTATFDQGHGGNLLVNAQSVEVIGATVSGQPSSGFFVDSEGSGDAGNLTINATNLILRSGGNFSIATVGDGRGGNLIVNAPQSVQLLGTTVDGRSSSSFSAFTLGAKDAGNVTINTGKLIVRDGADIFAATFGAGRGGNITIISTDNVEISGTGKVGNTVFSSGLVSQSEVNTTGNAGNILVTTGKLTVRDGARISASTFGAGKAGNLTIDAFESVDVFGTSFNQELASRLSAQVNTDATGNGGELRITTGKLTVRDGAEVSASTFGTGNTGILVINARDMVEVGGASANNRIASGLFNQVGSGGRGNARDFRIDTKQLIVRDGAEISASTRGKGNAGSLVVNASESVRVVGTGVSGSRVTNLSARSFEDGNAGDLRITTGKLFVENTGKISVSGLGAGQPGSLEIAAGTISLNQGRIDAETASGGNANIRLRSDDYILMRNQSLINARALNNGNGGNINIDTNFLVAVDEEDNDIIANAFKGSGGRINIKAESIFGIAPRDKLTIRSDINASSELGVDGTIDINTPDVDPSRGLIALPTNLVDASQQIAQSCRTGGVITASKKSEFVITGRGGLPPNPSEPISSDAVWQDLQFYTDNTEVLRDARTENNISPLAATIIEAQGWIIDTNKNVTLVAGGTGIPACAMM
ncbi:MAG: S-layer family protein [Calothrix sp. FI2-JRJ7]|jgi:filamentous hemagglutinin family protein|nr:S-layer family protein [Calothrix sp. FI2-JRJ7]